MVKLATKLAQAKGHGSAKSGVHHWWAQRLSGLILVPLLLWFILSIALSAPSATVDTWSLWLVTPVVTIAIVLLGGAVIYHAQLGLQVIIEDYIHNLFWRLTCLALNKIVAILASITLLVSLIHLMITHSTTGHI